MSFTMGFGLTFFKILALSEPKKNLNARITNGLFNTGVGKLE